MKVNRKDHKGQNGRVLVVGGSKDYVGAPAFAALAALRTGVDLVTVCAPEKVAWTINTYSPDLITKKLFGEELSLNHCKEIIALSEQNDVVVLGVGLGNKKDFVLKLLRGIKKPCVIDADAIKVISIDVAERSVFTPHVKEFEMLYYNTMKKPEFDHFDMDVNLKRIQNYMGSNVILLKGEYDTIFSRSRRHVNKSGHNAMTVGGTGDILAGICAGYIAQTGKLFESAKEAAYVSGRLGEYMYKQKGYAMTAYDMVNELWRFTR